MSGSIRLIGDLCVNLHWDHHYCRLISKSYKIHFGATSEPHFESHCLIFFQMKSACLSFSSCCAASLVWEKGLAHYRTIPANKLLQGWPLSWQNSKPRSAVCETLYIASSRALQGMTSLWRYPSTREFLRMHPTPEPNFNSSGVRHHVPPSRNWLSQLQDSYIIYIRWV